MKELITVLLIQLVLTIPFYTTSVYAGINKVTVKGGDGIEGFAKANDFLNFNAQAAISNDSITNEQVVLGSDAQFDKCTPSISNGSECTLRFPSNGTELFEAKSMPFTISLFKDDKTLDDSKSGSVTIDNKPPQVKLTSSQNRFFSHQNIVINYEVTDFACDDTSCSGKCSGLKNIEFRTSNGTFKQTIDLTKDANECNFKSNISIETTAFNDGQNSVFAKAVDRFNQPSQEMSVTFSVDTSSPAIVSNSFAILRKDISLSTFSPSKVPVEVVVNISATDLNLNSVTADLSALNPSSNLRNTRAACTTVEDGLNICKWTIELGPASGGSKTIVINASDTSGNKESIAISRILSLDEKGPVVLSLSTATASGGKVFGKPSGNTVTGVFDEATGLSADEVFLNVGSSKIQVSHCSKETNWACTWDNINFGSSSQMSVHADTADVLGNSVSGVANVDVIVDQKAPQLIGMNISPVGGLTQAFQGFFKIGDKVAVVANLSDDNDVFGVGDFSKFISEAVDVAGSCERIEQGKHVCTWLTDAINLEASAAIVFNFSDSAGNKLVVTRALKTFGLENATVPDFWTNTVACSPKAIDRELGPLINQRVYCHISLKPKTTKAVSTVFIGAAACSGNSSIIETVDTFNTEAGSTSPVIEITLKKDEFKINNANFSCSFNVFSKVGSSITKNPEIENVKAGIEFFNLPLGELSQRVKDKIEDAKDDAEGIWELVGKLNKVVYWAKKICQIIHTLYNIVAILYSIAYILGIADIAGQKTIFGIFTITPAAIAGCEAETKTRVAVAQPTKHVLNKFCDYVTCQQTILWGPTMQNLINNIPYISPGEYVGVKTKVEGEGLFKQKVVSAETSEESTYYDYLQNKRYGLKPISQYMDPEHNLVVATLFACLPGIIYGLDKYRQIKCLYADCLQNAVGKDGMPVTACEDQKAYATCKYITGEIFAVIPWTAVFDHFFGLVKNALSNPFAALGAAISLGCGFICPDPNAESRLSAWTLCEAAKLFSQIGDAVQNVKNIIDEGFKIRQDYCKRLDFDDDKKKDKEKEAAKSETKKK